MTKCKAILIIIAITTLFIGCCGACSLREFGFDGSVCVCNASYCDLPAKLPAMDKKKFYMYTSSLSGLRLDLSEMNISHVSKDDGVAFTLEPSVMHQKVEGFGGAFTDAAGINIASLSEETQAKLIAAYFSRDGIGYTLGRVPIGGTDFSTRPYTYAEDHTDNELKNFKLSEEDYLYKLPFIRQAYNATQGALRIIAAAWTAPPWMKTNRNYTGVGSLQKTYYSLWAQYHIKFLDAYMDNGVKVWSLSTGNEPLNGDIPLYPFNCMGWSPGNLQKWVVQHLGPALKDSPYNQTLILTYDDQRFELPAWLKIEFQDARMFDLISGIGVHWYWDKVAPLDFLDKAHSFLTEKFILATESCITKKINQPVVKLGSWQRGEAYAESIIDDMNHWVAGWVDWNLALDASGGPNWAKNVVDAAVIVNATADEFYKQPMFYALGHFSKFVPVGSRRIHLSHGSKLLKGVAFNTPVNTTVVVLLNKGKEESVSIQSGNNRVMSFVMPSKSIVTLISENVSTSGTSQTSSTPSGMLAILLLLFAFKTLNAYPLV